MRTTLGHKISRAAFSRHRLDGRLRFRRRGRTVLPALVGQEGEGHAEDVDVFRLEQLRIRVHLVGRTAQAAPDHLLAEELAGEGAETHDVGDGLRIPALRQHPDRNHVLYPLARMTGAAHRIHLQAEHLGLLLSGQLARAVFVGVVPAGNLGDRFLGGFGRVEHLGVDMEGPIRIAEFVDADTLTVERVLDPSGGLGAVGHGDHHGRGDTPPRRPVPDGLAPVVAEQIVSVHHQVRQGLLRSGRPVQIVPDFRIAVDVVEAGLVRPGVGHGVVADHHPRRLDQAGLDGVVQSEIAHDPVEQRFLGTSLARRREGCGGEVVADENAARPVDSIQPADPLGRFLDGAPGDAADLGPGRDTPCVMRLVVDDQDVPGARHVAEHVADIGFVALGSTLVDATFAGDLLVRLPIERVPVADRHLALAQLVKQSRGHDVEDLVVVLRMRW